MGRFRILWSAPLIAVGLYAMAIDLLHMPSGRYPRQVWAGVDFHTYVAAAFVGVRDGWNEIYDQGIVAARQEQMVPRQFSQPYLSPPPDSWLAAPFLALPYWLALSIWAVLLLASLAVALGWTSTYRGSARVAAVFLALTPWWVLVAVYVGQVVPLVAAAVLIAWRLSRENREIAAGVVLCVLALKPNTAFIVPFALLAAGRWRTFAVWATASAVIAGASALLIGADGAADYLAALTRPPTGASALTLGGALGLSGPAAMWVRAGILVGALAAAYGLRAKLGLAMAVGVLASLTTSTYLHNSDLCLLVAAGWMVWHEAPVWRVALLAMLVAASPLLSVRDLGPTLQGWVRIELTFLAGLLGTALITWLMRDRTSDLLTARADFGKQAPA